MRGNYFLLLLILTLAFVYYGVESTLFNGAFTLKALLNFYGANFEIQIKKNIFNF